MTPELGRHYMRELAACLLVFGAALVWGYRALSKPRNCWKPYNRWRLRR